MRPIMKRQKTKIYRYSLAVSRRLSNGVETIGIDRYESNGRNSVQRYVVIMATMASRETAVLSESFSIKCIVVGSIGSVAERTDISSRGKSSIFFLRGIHCPFQRLFIAFSKENEANEQHVAKQDFDEPCAVMPARTDLWDLWGRNRPEPPGDLPRR